MRLAVLFVAVLTALPGGSGPARAATVPNWIEAASALGGQARSQVALAMFEAANRVDRRYQSYLGLPPSEGEASIDAAIATAGFGVLKFAYPAQAPQLQAALDLDLGQVPEGPAKARGIEIGQAAAAATMKRLTATGEAAPDYLPRTTPGEYVPTDLPVLPLGAYRAKPWFLASSGEFTLAPPPPLDGAVWARDYAEVSRLGRKTGSARSAAQTAQASFWVTGNLDPTLRLLSAVKGLGPVQEARLYALATMALTDASQAMTVAKYDHRFWRPITAIRNGANDNNPATVPDASWEPLLRTPLHPEYPCGHCILAATFATIVKSEFGKDTRLTFVDPAMQGGGLTLTPDEYVQSVAMSRIYAGAHYRFSNEAGIGLGERIGMRAVTGFMRPLSNRRR